jgi:hypothetical protein
MAVQRTQSYTFLLFTLLAFQQSCKTPSAPQPPTPTSETDITIPEAKSEALPEVGTASRHPMESISTEIPPESVLDAPEKDRASPELKYDSVLLTRAPGIRTHSGWQYRKNQQGKIVGFEFSNQGGNPVLPYRHDIEKNLFFTRDFQFRFDERARQDIQLVISDWAPSRDKQFRLSELVNSVMHFFPRRYLPAIASASGRSIVTLPTGEKVEFDARTHEVLAGVFSEAPVDLNPDKVSRKFPGIEYTGRGVIVRANARGADPRMGTLATITTGSPVSECEGRDCNQCQVHSKELWIQRGALRFRFPTDEEFDRYLIMRCGFGLFKNSPSSMKPSSSN